MQALEISSNVIFLSLSRRVSKIMDEKESWVWLNTTSQYYRCMFPIVSKNICARRIGPCSNCAWGSGWTLLISPKLCDTQLLAHITHEAISDSSVFLHSLFHFPSHQKICSDYTPRYHLLHHVKSIAWPGSCLIWVIRHGFKVLCAPYFFHDLLQLD
jgi:hypothetical protein